MLELATHGIQYLRVAVAEDHRAPGADVVDVALVVLVDDIGAFGVLEEQRGAADAAEGANRRVDAAGDVGLGAGKEGFGTGHAGLAKQGRAGISDPPWRNQGVLNSWLKAWARRSTSAALSAANRAWITAIICTPSAISDGAVSSVMPPMATMGRPIRARASRSNS